VIYSRRNLENPSDRVVLEMAEARELFRNWETSILILLLTLINMKYKKAPSAHDELIRLYIWPCFHR